MMQTTVDWPRVLDDLSIRESPLTVEVLEGGVSCHIERAVLPSQTLVARRHRDKSWKEADASAMTREYELHNVLHDAGLAVPRALLLDAAGGILGAPGFVMEHVDGSSESGLTTSQTVALMARFLAELHARSLDAVALPELEERDDPMDEMLPWLEDREADRLRGRAWSQPNPTVLLHGDFWPNNILWQDGEIAAVLDWEDAALGDPMADVAGCRLELAIAHDSLVADAFLEAYLRLAPFDTQNLPAWEVYVASACRKFVADWGLSEQRTDLIRRRAGQFLQAALKRL